jgi:hypothetical protein
MFDRFWGIMMIQETRTAINAASNTPSCSNQATTTKTVNGIRRFW